MNKPNMKILFLGAYALMLTVALGYVVSQNWWSMTHAKQVQMTRASFENYANDWKITPLKADASETK